MIYIYIYTHTHTNTFSKYSLSIVSAFLQINLFSHINIYIKHRKHKQADSLQMDPFPYIMQFVNSSLVYTMDWRAPSFPVQHELPEHTQTHVHRVSDAIQPSHPLLLLPSIFPSSGSFPMSQLFASGGRSIGFSLQHQSFQWIFKTTFL